jgi:hypothetical protein
LIILNNLSEDEQSKQIDWFQSKMEKLEGTFF